MGALAAAGYLFAAVSLFVAGGTLWSRGTMSDVPLYDVDEAADAASLARVVSLSLVAFATLTLAFATFEAFDGTTEAVVAGYAVAVMVVAIVTVGFTRKYE